MGGRSPPAPKVNRTDWVETMKMNVSQAGVFAVERTPAAPVPPPPVAARLTAEKMPFESLLKSRMCGGAPDLFLTRMRKQCPL